MANYDQFAAAVKEISGGKNVVLLDDAGLPSVYVPIYKMKNSELVSGLSDNIHPAFSVESGGAQVEKSCFYFSKYINVVINGCAYSLAHRDPKVNVTFDKALSYCQAKGAGFHLTTLAEWACVALWCRKNGTMPHGNNHYGADVTYPHEKGQESYNDGTNTCRTFTGSGPATWGHDHTIFGIQDMNGDVWERVSGQRMQDGELQVIAYNNAALGADCDQSATSTLWKAIAEDGSLVEPGTDGTLKWDYVSSHIQLTSGDLTDTTDAGVGCTYQSMTLADGLTAPELAKVLLLYPDEPGGDYGSDYHYFNPTGERLPLCGGSWTVSSGAGVFNLYLNYSRSNSNTGIGFRSAYVEL